MSTPIQPHAAHRTAFGIGPDGSGLTDEHFREVVRLARLLPGGWFVERREDDLGAVSVLLVPDAEGSGGPAFALFRLAREINLDLCRGEHFERFEPLGTFRTVRQAVEQILRMTHDAARGGASGEGAH